jgi:tetratricopeptide (TPR) repeat protein
MKKINLQKSVVLVSVIAVILLGVLIFVLLSRNTEEPEEKKESNSVVLEYEKKLPELKAKVDENPNDFLARKEYASALYITGNLKESILHFEKAMELNPKDSSVYNNVGNAYRDVGEYEEAVDVYKKAIEFDVKNLNAYNNLANLYISKFDDLEKSLEVYNDAVKKNPEQKEEILILIASVYEYKGNHEKANDVYREILQINPENSTALKNVEN